jgi:thiol:disulfide interchange protein
MRKLLPFLVLTALMLNSQAAAKWLTDFEAAKKQAQKEDKAILMDFTGSTWCAPCKALKKNVFSHKDFAKFAEQKLVLLEVDFPPDTAKAPQANQKLEQEYKVPGFPTIIIVDKNGKELGRTEGYEGESRASFIKKLETFLARAK